MPTENPKQPKEILVDLEATNFIIMARKADLKCFLSLQVIGKATSIELTQEQTAALLNCYAPIEARIWQEWVAI